jgi:dihydrolipoamide dehydrogenase
VGVETAGYVEVDDHMRVSGMPWLYAIGDINGRALFTHAGKYQARVAADNILGCDAVAHGDRRGSPRVVFTEPQVAAVGQTLERARSSGLEVEAIDLATDSTAGSSFYGHQTGGTTRFLVDAEREVLVGATFVGVDVAEMLHAATIAVACEVHLASLTNAVAAFPTRSELWLRFLEEYERRRGGSLHAHAGAGGQPLGRGALSR